MTAPRNEAVYTSYANTLRTSHARVLSDLQAAGQLLHRAFYRWPSQDYATAHLLASLGVLTDTAIAFATKSTCEPAEFCWLPLGYDTTSSDAFPRATPNSAPDMSVRQYLVDPPQSADQRSSSASKHVGHTIEEIFQTWGTLLSPSEPESKDVLAESAESDQLRWYEVQFPGYSSVSEESIRLEESPDSGDPE